MAEQCIVCLGDLRTSDGALPPPETAAAHQDGDDGVVQQQQQQPDAAKSSLRDTRLSNKSTDHDDDEIVARILPCKHDLHNACLTPWVERANSCPICRAKFNQVQLSKTIGGEVIDSYAVQDKVQEAELDPTMIIEDELFAAETWEPCIVCGELDDGHSSMYCDGCDKAVHIFCAGFDDAPDVWYCENCLVDVENSTELPGLGRALRRRPRRRAPPPAAGRRLGGRHETSWARVWQEVLRGTAIDLDFPFEEDEDPLRDTRTPQQRREFRVWQRRFEAAENRGANARLRGIVTSQAPQPAVRPPPESQEELRAWNAFEKAQDVRSGRKRRATASPASPREPEAEPRKLKRPRLRRPAGSAASPPAESSSAAAQRAGEGGSTFISSLLREVENRASSTSAGSPAGSDHVYGQQSPRNTSPARSPGSSGYGSGRAGSASPPPAGPQSPLPSLPLSPPSHTFSPFSPAVESLDPHGTSAQPDHQHHLGRRRENHDSGYDEHYHNGSNASSPSRMMSYSAKQEIQRMVKLALAPRYREKSISKDQYTDINRDVSRKMYDLVGDARSLTDHDNRARWQGVAEEEVRKAVEGLSLGAPSPSSA